MTRIIRIGVICENVFLSTRTNLGCGCGRHETVESVVQSIAAVHIVEEAVAGERVVELDKGVGGESVVGARVLGAEGVHHANVLVALEVEVVVAAQADPRELLADRPRVDALDSRVAEVKRAQALELIERTPRQVRQRIVAEVEREQRVLEAVEARLVERLEPVAAQRERLELATQRLPHIGVHAHQSRVGHGHAAHARKRRGHIGRAQLEVDALVDEELANDRPLDALRLDDEVAEAGEAGRLAYLERADVGADESARLELARGPRVELDGELVEAQVGQRAALELERARQLVRDDDLNGRPEVARHRLQVAERGEEAARKHECLHEVDEDVVAAAGVRRVHEPDAVEETRR